MIANLCLGSNKGFS